MRGGGAVECEDPRIAGSLYVTSLVSACRHHFEPLGKTPGSQGLGAFARQGRVSLVRRLKVNLGPFGDGGASNQSAAASCTSSVAIGGGGGGGQVDWAIETATGGTRGADLFWVAGARSTGGGGGIAIDAHAKLHGGDSGRIVSDTLERLWARRFGGLR